MGVHKNYFNTIIIIINNFISIIYEIIHEISYKPKVEKRKMYQHNIV